MASCFFPARQGITWRSKRVPADSSGRNAESYLSLVNCASVQSPIPIIASLNGESGGNWLDFAGELQEAGAAAIELNVHHPPPAQYSGPREVEDSLVDLVSEINTAISIPLLLKLDRDYTSPSHLSHRLLSGAQGLVLFRQVARRRHLPGHLGVKNDLGTHASGFDRQVTGENHADS